MGGKGLWYIIEEKRSCMIVYLQTHFFFIAVRATKTAIIIRILEYTHRRIE